MPKATLHAYIRHDPPGFMVECAEVNVVTGGVTLDETVLNLREAVALALDDGGSGDFDVEPSPLLVVTFEVQAAVA